MDEKSKAPKKVPAKKTKTSSKLPTAGGGDIPIPFFKTNSGEYKAPISLIGLVINNEFDVCMDGIPYLILSHDLDQRMITTRIRGANDETNNVLKELMGRRSPVLVIGYIKPSNIGPHCNYFEAYFAKLAFELM
jgi:hypothetical protein